MTAPLEPVPLRISCHPQAPLFEGSDGRDILMQIIDMVARGTLDPHTNEHHRELMRQAGFVNLWFFLRVIAAYSGGYDKLTPHLHADMANFFQKIVESPGTKAAGFIGRAHYKSTVWSYGGLAWLALRNPDISIGLASSIAALTLKFLHYIQDIFTKNALFALLYPEYVPPPGRQVGWNDEMMTLPNKTKNFREATILPITAGGSSQGNHFDWLHLDDIIGDTMLDTEHNSAADMIRMANWLKSSIRTLVKDWRTSTVFVAGTRYAPDDAYEAIMTNIKDRYGCWEGLNEIDAYLPERGNEWTVYYRQIEENGHIIFPESFTREVLDKMLLEDPWTYYTQYVNNPYIARQASMSDMEVQECYIDFINNKFMVTYYSGFAGREVTESLREMDLVAACDPAASEKRISMATSRSAYLVYATTWRGEKLILEIKSGYLPITTVFDWLFEGEKRYNVRATLLEAQGPFRLLVAVLQKEQNTRRQWLHLRPVSAVGKKEDRIESTLRTLLMRQVLYATPEAKRLIMDELMTFPNGKKNDILDALTIAEKGSVIPRKPVDEDDEDYERTHRRRVPISSVTGY